VRIVRFGVLATTMACLAAVAGPASLAGAAQARAQAGQVQATAGLPGAPGVVLVNQPARTVCTRHKFRVGVWYQVISGGSRAYRVGIWGPSHRRFFYRAGTAPSGHWRFWRVLAGRSGRYRVVYSEHRPGSTRWTRYVAITRARRCP
jgi:hypothetical protein